MIEQSQGRNGVPDHIVFHRQVTLAALEQIDDKEKHGLYLNITGGFQSGKTKHMCHNQDDDKCRFCNEMDTKQHRLLSCSHFNALRRQHPRAVEILTSEHRDWLWIPIAYEHDLTSLFAVVMQSKPQITLTDINQWDVPRDVTLRFLLTDHVYTRMINRPDVLGFQLYSTLRIRTNRDLRTWNNLQNAGVFQNLSRL